MHGDAPGAGALHHFGGEELSDQLMPSLGLHPEAHRSKQLAGGHMPKW